MTTIFRSSTWVSLAIFVGVLVIVTASLLIGVSYVFARDMLVDQIHERLTVAATARRSLLLAYVRQQQERVSLVASRTRLRQLLESHADGQIDETTFQTESRRIIMDAQTGTADFLDILITDIDGQVVTATSDTYLGQDLSTEPAFIEGQVGSYLGLPQWQDDGYQTFLSGPTITNDGRWLGVVLVKLNLERMVQLLKDTTALGATGEVLVATQIKDQAVYLLPPRHAPDLTSTVISQVPAMAQAIQGRTGFMETSDYRNADVLALYQPVGYQDWGIVAKIDIGEAYTAVERLRFVLLSIGGVILLLGLAATYILARRFTRPITKLAHTATIFGAGDLSARVGLPPSSSELNQLVQAFDNMAHNLQTSYEALKREILEHKETAGQLRMLNETLEQRVEERTQELARSNSELEQFAYAASHDLQEPLRKIQAFGDRLQATSGDGLDERGQDYLARMQAAAQRMQTLISDLLAFSRITTKGEPFISVNLTQIVRQVVDDLQTMIEQRGGQVEVGDLPDIEADPVQMRQLFQNLISNGLKYQPVDGIPCIKIYGQMLKDDDTTVCQINVEDNGIGFDEKYLDRIFILFQRLHGRNVYTGTGIGLALCSKIVQRHRGFITAKSTPGQGSNFIVTLPVQQTKKEGV